jgi:hypothetical protein
VLTTLWQPKDDLGSTTTLLDASGLVSFTRKSDDAKKTWWSASAGM